MNNDLTKLIRSEIERRKQSDLEISSKVRELQKIYNELVAKRRKNKETAALMVFGQGEFELFYEFKKLIGKYNIVLYEELESLIDEVYNIEQKKWEISQASSNQTYLSSNQYYEAELSKLEAREQRVKQKTMDFFEYAQVYYIELFEKLYEEKERKKEVRKIYESALKTLTKNRTLSAAEIKAITELIENSEIDKSKCYEILNNYIKQKEEKLNSAKKEETTPQIVEEIKQPIYIDEELVESKETKEDNLITNYVATIYTLKNDKKSLKEFLDGISYNVDFEDILDKILIAISEKDDNNLKEYLLSYKEELSKQEEIIDKDSDEITVLYYGFLQDKEKILVDIEKSIPEEEYKNILKALEQIKLDGAINNRKNIVRIRKVFKLRVDDIRVTFKRISKNVYVILGVYMKKDNHGAKIIFSTERRNNHLLRDESQIIKAMEISELWDSYLQKNSEFEENIFKLIKKHIYSV